MNQSPGTVEAVGVNGQIDPLDELPVAYVEIDAHGAITRANRLTRSLHSIDCGELIGKKVWDLMPTDEQEQSCAVFQTAMETGENPPVARRSLFTNSGAFRVHELHRNLIRDVEGRSVGMRVVTVDVTEAHKAREEAERARAWLASVLESIAEAVIVTDALGFIRTANPAAEELFGWRAEELAGKTIEKALPVLKFVSGNKTRLDFTMALESRTRGVATLLDRERRELNVEISTSPIVDKEGGFTTGVVTVLRRVDEVG